MKYTYRVINPQGVERTESMTAKNEEELKRLLEMMGYKLMEITSKEEDKGFLGDLSPEELAKLAATTGVPNMGGGGTQPKQITPPSPPKPQYKTYKDNGVEYRVELTSGVLQKKDWVKVVKADLMEYATMSDGKMITLHSSNTKLYKLQWVDVG